jgi:hypothetical protein
MPRFEYMIILKRFDGAKIREFLELDHPITKEDILKFEESVGKKRGEDYIAWEHYALGIDGKVWNQEPKYQYILVYINNETKVISNKPLSTNRPINFESLEVARIGFTTIQRENWKLIDIIPMGLDGKIEN